MIECRAGLRQHNRSVFYGIVDLLYVSKPLQGCP